MNIGGKKVNNWYIVGGAAGVFVVLFIWKKGAGSGAGSSSSSGIDPVTGMPYSQDSQVDPLTGMSYLAEAQQYGSVSAAESATASAGNYGSFYGSSGGGGYGGTAGYPTFYGNSTASGTSFATNAQWAQAVTQGLTALGYSSTDVAAALGLYFQDMPLGTAPDGVSYTSIVQAAVAEFGPPPVGSFSIVPSGNGSGGGGGGGTLVTVPNVIGLSAGSAHNAIAAVGLVPVDADWTRGDASRVVTGQSPNSGTQVASGSKVSYTVAAAPTSPPGQGSGSTSGPSTPGSGFKGDTGVTTAGPIRGYGGAGPNVPGSIKTTTGGQIIYYPAGTDFNGLEFKRISDFKVLGVIGQNLPVGS